MTAPGSDRVASCVVMGGGDGGYRVRELALPEWQSLTNVETHWDLTSSFSASSSCPSLSCLNWEADPFSISSLDGLWRPASLPAASASCFRSAAGCGTPRPTRRGIEAIVVLQCGQSRGVATVVFRIHLARAKYPQIRQRCRRFSQQPPVHLNPYHCHCTRYDHCIRWTFPDARYTIPTHFLWRIRSAGTSVAFRRLCEVFPDGCG